MRTSRSVLLLFALLLACTRMAIADPNANSQPDAAILRQQGVTADREGVSKLLRDLRPSDKQRERIAALIVLLGHDEYAKREAATLDLMRMPRPPLRELKEAAKSDDAEVQLRAERILAGVGEPSTSAVLFVACRVIAQKKLTGLAQDVTEAAAEVDSEPVRNAVRLAMAATISADDVAMLLKALKSGHVEVRVAAMWGLAAARGKDAIEAIEPLLADSKEPPALRLAAAEAMAMHERPSSAAALVDLLDADIPAIRGKAALLLRTISGRSYDFAHDGPADERARHKQQWAHWLKTDGRIVKAPAAPKARWTDFFDNYVIHGSYEGSRTAFVKGVPKLVRDHFETVSRTADTTGSITDRHRVAKWLYPIEGKGERPQVVIETDRRLYPIWGSWQQRWNDWIVLNENSSYIQNADAHGGAHWESRLEYVIVPAED